MDRKYVVQFVGAMVSYMLVLLASIWLVGVADGEWWRYLVVLLPMIPAVLVLFAVVGYLGRVDELQRKVQFEALSFAFAGTALLTFGYGFMQTAGMPQVSWFFVWPVMAALWLVGVFVARARYR